LFEQKTKIKTVVLAFLGDFISNSIHEELMESNQLSPMPALLEVMSCLYSGIDMFLEQSDYNLVIPCCYGNHGRTTKERRHATAAGNSLEWLMYNMMAQHYIDLKQKRVKFLIADGYHLYLDIYGKSIRFHHGDDLRYQGGVGGLYIPVNKAIAQWNKGRHADLDVFGHWHQFRDGGNFVCNGSLIGYNAYALSIKADFEEPVQGLVFREKDLGTTGRFPIFLKKT
jgi:hypothetical protein